MEKQKKVDPFIEEHHQEFGALDKILEKLVSDPNRSRLDLIREILVSALKLAKDSPGTLNLKITSTVLRELRYSFKMFSPHRATPKITMFGSARVKENTPLYEFAKNFALFSKSKGYMIITGGGPGIMQAGNEGGFQKTFGLNIRLPFEQIPNPFIDTKTGLINYKYFFTRKLFLVKEACAFAFFPGGFGTFDEAFEALTLLQTGKTNLVPIVLMEPKGSNFWEPFCEYIDTHLVENGYVSPQDMALFHIFHDPESALKHIEHFYKIYHSMRFVKDKIVIRLKTKIPESYVEKISDRFSTLADAKKFRLQPPLEEERNEPELSHLPRLIFTCPRKDFGELRLLIDFINAAPV